jgi:aminopeptidase Y
MMTRTGLFVALAVLGPASAIQIPLVDYFKTLTPVNTLEKDLVNTTKLQASIKADNLLKRAEQLFEIAKLGEDEYNHPTRVIGSKGKYFKL